eukprot:1102172-Ditylum_brightwellii.AAC.1
MAIAHAAVAAVGTVAAGVVVRKDVQACWRLSKLVRGKLVRSAATTALVLESDLQLYELNDLCLEVLLSFGDDCSDFILKDGKLLCPLSLFGCMENEFHLG